MTATIFRSTSNGRRCLIAPACSQCIELRCNSDDLMYVFDLTANIKASNVGSSLGAHDKTGAYRDGSGFACPIRSDIDNRK